MNKMKLLQMLFVTLLPFILGGCDQLGLQTDYGCAGKGYVYHYKDGVRVEPANIEQIKFTLSTYAYKKTFALGQNDILTAHQQQDIALDKSRSTEAEVTYLTDLTDPNSKVRTVSSLVLNLVSGDFRVYHHKWIPPVEWKDSDQYFYTGNCMKLKS